MCDFLAVFSNRNIKHILKCFYQVIETLTKGLKNSKKMCKDSPTVHVPAVVLILRMFLVSETRGYVKIGLQCA